MCLRLLSLIDTKEGGGFAHGLGVDLVVGGKNFCGFLRPQQHNIMYQTFHFPNQKFSIYNVGTDFKNPVSLKSKAITHELNLPKGH